MEWRGTAMPFEQGNDFGITGARYFRFTAQEIRLSVCIRAPLQKLYRLIVCPWSFFWVTALAWWRHRRLSNELCVSMDWKRLGRRGQVVHGPSPSHLRRLVSEKVLHPLGHAAGSVSLQAPDSEPHSNRHSHVGMCRIPQYRAIRNTHNLRGFLSRTP